MNSTLTSKIQTLFNDKTLAIDGVWGIHTELMLARFEVKSMVERSAKMLRQDAIAVAKRLHIDSEFFVRIIELESGFNPRAVSATGAIGLGQITTPALDQFNKTARPSRSVTRDELLNPDVNLVISGWYLNWVRVQMLPQAKTVVLTGPQRALVYAGYNLGIGAARDLQEHLNDGVVPSARLQKSFAVQARKLTRDGYQGYLGHVEALVG